MAGGNHVRRKFLARLHAASNPTHYIQSERFAKQIQMPHLFASGSGKRSSKRKIRAQGLLLKELQGNDGGLVEMSKRVQSGDKGNLGVHCRTALLAIDLWKSEIPPWRNWPGSKPASRLRLHRTPGTYSPRICVPQDFIHPSESATRTAMMLSVFAADLMEPFPPVVDRRVFEWIQENPILKAPFDQQMREAGCWEY